MASNASTQAKRKYNKNAYSTYLFSYRKRSELAERISEIKTHKDTSLNFLITKLLAEHFDVPIPIPEHDIL
jgi:predicted amidophosphoribosyltransferase